MYLIGKVFQFEAAHQLPNHDGKCAHLHGHTYTVEVILQGSKLQGIPAKEGMLVDFSIVGDVFKRLVFDKFDHKYLNDLVDFRTTAENLASYIFSVMTNGMDQARREANGLTPWPMIRAVKVWETQTSWAEYRAD